MRAVVNIAVNVFKESVRDKVLYNLVLFAVLLIAASYLIGQLTAGQDVKIIKDLGLASISIFGLFIAVFIGITLVSKEVERRSIYSLLAKPLHRWHIVAGKYVGLVLTLIVNVAVMTASLYALLLYMSWGEVYTQLHGYDPKTMDPAMLKAVALILVELAVITAVALFFSTFSTPIMSAIFTIGLYIVGHFSSDLRDFGQVVDNPAVARLTKALYWVLPNLTAFDVKAQAVHGVPVPATYMAISITYALTYIAMLLAAAMFIFSRRDFK